MASIAHPRFVVGALIVVCSAIELYLLLADLGWIATLRTRQGFYENGGFWPGLLNSWQPNYPTQPYAMFFTYSFLHSGPSHLLVNMVSLWSLAGPVLARVGARGFSLLYGSAILGGAIGYASLSQTPTPMVGASGALFGLVGGLLAWNYVDRFSFKQRLLPVVQSVGLLIGLNLVLWWAMDGKLAWQTHLGGFVSGWLCATLIDPRPRPNENMDV